MAGAEFIVVSGDSLDENGNTPWQAYKAATESIRDQLGSDTLYELYMNGLIYLDAQDNICESEY